MIFPITQMKKEKIKIKAIYKIMELPNDKFGVVIYYKYNNECYLNSLVISKELFNKLDALVLPAHSIDTCDDSKLLELMAEIYVIINTGEKGIYKFPLLKSIFMDEESETDG